VYLCYIICEEEISAFLIIFRYVLSEDISEICNYYLFEKVVDSVDCDFQMSSISRRNLVGSYWLCIFLGSTRLYAVKYFFNIAGKIILTI